MMMCFPGGRMKAVTLSYDDGVEQDRRLMRILDDHGLRCTFNINSGLFAPEGTVYPEGQIHRRMSESQVLELYGPSGHEIAVHGSLHEDWTQQGVAGAMADIFPDRMKLERLFGRIIRGAAYPFGSYDDDAVEALRTAGIVYCRTVESSHSLDIPRDWLRLRPSCHHAEPALQELTDALLADRPFFRPLLLYVWGHAYEFEAMNNWELIERWAGRVGGHENIWYATNIEVCDYVSAWRRLIPSADATRVCNPTAQTLWVMTRGGPVTVAPGEEKALA